MTEYLCSSMRGGGGGSCSLYNSNDTNNIDIHTQRIAGLQVRALFL